ncbi:hypothetical protein C8A00DRAFT_29511 [Chaetomidium leptoderma]|uniref:Mediator of RNA polymerase II transcription subunit 11 n=1 Tax=Chaetomidium leptoderma TaxID=669021 RepID=A0AAN7A137_9PEZI|nr:hypothetical protein C8A00DRAFT_29511 [Chaetomidium leptoderma]
MNGSTQPPAPNGDGGDGGIAIDIHQPFTPGERIQQLSETDKDIASLLDHLSSAMRALATPPGTSQTNNKTTPPTVGSDDIPAADSDSSETDHPLTAFTTAQSSFFNTVDRIDKHLTRQILALEEAGIITLRNTGGGVEGQQLQGGGGEQPGSSQQQQQQQQQLGGEVPGGGGGGGGGGGRVRAAGPARLEPDGMGRYGTLDVGKLNIASSTVERDMEEELWRRAREELARVVGQGGDGDGDGDRMEE